VRTDYLPAKRWQRFAPTNKIRMKSSNTSNDSNNPNPYPHGEREGAGSSTQKRADLVSPRENVQYRFALDEAGRSIDVATLNATSGRVFQCLGCGEPMVAKLGDQLAHHFAHKANSHCAGETYLHQLAKQVFREEFERCLNQNLAFQIEIPQRWVCGNHGSVSANICKTQPKFQVYDLVPDVSGFKLETAAQDFVPDITLFGRDGKPDIWIELAVTHPCSEAKLKAGQRIIEISIQTEADVELFRQHRLSAQDTRVKFIHFLDRVPKDMCEWYQHCQLMKRVILIYPDGRLDIRYIEKHASLSEATKQKAVWCLEEFVHRGDEPVSEPQSEALLREAALKWDGAARAAGHVIRSCGLCEHYDRVGDEGCAKFKSPVPWREAIRCEAFAHYEEWPGAEVD
jgi:hypothetical protein